jgi:hypothetical protein
MASLNTKRDRVGFVRAAGAKDGAIRREPVRRAAPREADDAARLERRLGQLAVIASRAQEALQADNLSQALASAENAPLRRAVEDLVGQFEVMVSGVTERLEGLHGVLQSLTAPTK